MPQSATCPACSRQFRFKPELAGRRVKCPQCGHAFALPSATPNLAAALPEPDLYALADGVPVASPAGLAPRQAAGSVDELTSASSAVLPAADDAGTYAAVDSTGGPPPVRKPRRRYEPREWSAWDRFLLTTGMTCVAFGLLSQILPLFGLQFRKLSQLGPAATTGGWGVAAIGAFQIVYVLFLRGRFLKLLLATAALCVIGITALLAWGWNQSRPQSRPGPPPGFPTAGPPGAPAGAYAPSRPGTAGPPNVPGRQPGVPDWPRTVGPTQPPPAVDYHSLCARYGAPRVVRIRFHSASGADVAGAVRGRLPTLLPAGVRPTWRVQCGGDECELVLAPCDDVNALARGLDLGEVKDVNRQERTATIALDGAKASK